MIFFNNNSKECSICYRSLFSSYAEKEVTITECQHIFHKTCFQERIERKSDGTVKCKVCKTGLKNFQGGLNVITIARKYLNHETQDDKGKVNLIAIERAEACLKSFQTLQWNKENYKKEFNDPDFVLALISNKPEFLRFASENLLNNPHFMIKAILQNSSCLEFVREKIKNHPYFISSIIEKTNDKKLVYRLVQYMCESVYKSPKENVDLANVLQNQKFMLDVIEKNENCIHFIFFVGPIFLNNRRFLSKVIDKIENKDLIFEFVEQLHKEIKNETSEISDLREHFFNEDFMAQIINRNPKCLRFLNEKLLKSPEFIVFLIVDCLDPHHLIDLIKMLDEQTKRNEEVQEAINYVFENNEFDKKQILEWLKYLPVYKFLDEKNKNNLDFCRAAIEFDPSQYFFFPKEIQAMEEMVLSLAKKKHRPFE